jgi:hypothetical protein
MTNHAHLVAVHGEDRTLMGSAREGGGSELLREVAEEARDHVRVATRTGRQAGDS